MDDRIVREKSVKPHDLAIVLVVVVAYISTFILADRPYTFFELVLLPGLGVVFLILSLWGQEFFARISSKRANFIYFAVQIPIAGLVLYFSRGNAWLIMMPLASQSVIMFSRMGVWVVNSLILITMLVNMILLTDNWRNIFQASTAFLAALFFVIVFTQMMLREQRGRTKLQNLADELSEANQKLREYAVQVEELAASSERNRLAREIHDGLGHFLTAIHVQIRAAAAVMPDDPSRAANALEKAQDLAQEALKDIRRSVGALRGEDMLYRPLPDMIETLLQESRAAGVVSGLNVQGAPRRLSQQGELTLFRAVQEGLTNVRKHSLASRVDITLEYCPELARVIIQDNGVGAATEAATGDQDQAGFGLFGLRERVQLLGGSFSVQTSSQSGFRLEIDIPE
jgi:signal transduction histidine kinase